MSKVPGSNPEPSNMGKQVKAGYVVPHPSLRREGLDVVGFIEAREVYSPEYLESTITPMHQQPTRWFERLAWWWLLAVRTVVSLLTGTLGKHNLNERRLARRAQLFNCDGQATASSSVLVGHVRSVLLNEPDNGWLHTLAMEVDCMRCQHAAWTELVRPTLPERLMDLAITCNLLFQCCLVYCLFPSVIHAYQVYRAEEDIWWLSTTLSMLDTKGRLPAWEHAKAPASARAYYALPASATVRDMLLRMRADEACIQHINHGLAGLAPGTPTDVVAVRQFGSRQCRNT